MSITLKVALAQLNLTVGDVAGNLAQVEQVIARARDALHTDLIIFPELTLTSYPPEDLLHHSGLQHQVEAALLRVARAAQGIAVLLGFPEYTPGGIYNSAALFEAGAEKARYRKQHRPNYSVFDEKRYFLRGESACVTAVKGIPVALTICEDLWQPGPAAQAAAAGAKLLLNISASPYEIGKQQQRAAAFATRAREAGMPLLTVNHVCGQDGLIFDGASFSMNAAGETVMRAPAFEAGLFTADFTFDGNTVQALAGEVRSETSPEASVYQAIVLGVRDYAAKNGFAGAVLGLSGGIDSALTLAIAVDALGADKVTAVMLPSRYTSDLSLRGAEQQAQIVGVAYYTIPIESAFAAFTDALAELFAGLPADATEENIQARCRGVLLMALSNKTGKLLLTTGNKSELAVGYATLYGDMAGGFAPLRDVFKTLVYRLVAYRNNLGEVIPREVIERAPSAELRADQKDSDSLPDYAVLDAILEAYIEDDKTFSEIVASGFDAATVERVVGMVQRNEYKRRQAPPGVRISRRAFGRDRRYPITSGYDPAAKL